MQRLLPISKARSTRSTRSTGMVDSIGKIEPDGHVDLAQIRRLGFFAKESYRERIVEADVQTAVVEFTVTCDPFEQFDPKINDPLKLRGWYLEGAGMDDGQGGHMRALVIFAPGGGDQLTAIWHTDEVAYRINAATGKTVVGALFHYHQ